MRLLAGKRTTHLRRVAVVDAQGTLCNIVSQASVTRFLSTHVSLLGEAAKQTVAALQLGSRPVHAVRFDTSARDTFALLDKTQISGLAITNESGSLFGNISGRDLKNFITKPDLAQLELPIKDFLANLRNESVDIRVPTILCFEHSSLQAVVDKLTATKVHRLYVVDGDSSLKPVAVVSVSDVVAQLLALADA